MNTFYCLFFSLFLFLINPQELRATDLFCREDLDDNLTFPGSPSNFDWWSCDLSIKDSILRPTSPSHPSVTINPSNTEKDFLEQDAKKDDGFPPPKQLEKKESESEPKFNFSAPNPPLEPLLLLPSPSNQDVQIFNVSIATAHHTRKIIEFATSEKVLEQAIRSVEAEINGEMLLPPTRFVYLSPDEAEKILRADAEVLLKDHPHKSKIWKELFTNRFFGYNREEERLKSLWGECEAIITSNYDWSAIKTKKDFTQVMRFLKKIDIFLGATPDEIKKGARYTYAPFAKLLGEDYAPLNGFLRICKAFSSENDFYSLFGDVSLFFKDDSELEDYFLDNDYSFLERGSIHELAKAANQIIQMTAEGDVLLMFGNTPSLLGRILKHRIEGQFPELPKVDREVILFPFSGAPNKIRKEITEDTLKNVTTPERVDYFNKSHLARHGLTSDNPKLQDRTLWIFDLIVSGSGPAFTLAQLFATYPLRAPLAPFPKVKMVALDSIHERWLFETPSEFLTATIASSDLRSMSHVYMGDQRLYLPNTREPSFSIPLVEMPLQCIGKLDTPACYQRVLPAYNAMYWSPYYEKDLYQEDNLYLKMFFKYFDLNVKRFFEKSKA
jgi:hypothetical protein